MILSHTTYHPPRMKKQIMIPITAWSLCFLWVGSLGNPRDLSVRRSSEIESDAWFPLIVLSYKFILLRLLLLGSRIVAFDVLDFLARSGTILLEILICTLDNHGREALMFGVFELLQVPPLNKNFWWTQEKSIHSFLSSLLIQLISHCHNVLFML